MRPPATNKRRKTATYKRRKKHDYAITKPTKGIRDSRWAIILPPLERVFFQQRGTMDCWRACFITMCTSHLHIESIRQLDTKISQRLTGPINIHLPTMWTDNQKMQNILNIDCVQFLSPSIEALVFNLALILTSKGPFTLAIPSHEDDECFHLVVIMGIDAARGVLLAHDPDPNRIMSQQHRTQHQRSLIEIKLTKAFKAGTPNTLFFTKERPILRPCIPRSRRYELKRIHEDSVIVKGTLPKSTFEDISKTVLKYTYDTSHGVAFRIEKCKDFFLIVQLIADNQTRKTKPTLQTNDNIEFIALVVPLTARMKVSKIELDVKNISEWTTCNLEGKRIEEILPLDDKEQTAIKGSVRRRQLRM